MVFNYFSGVNYFFLANKPAAQSPFIIGDWPWHILGFQIFGLIQFYLIYYLFNNVKNLKLPIIKKSLIKLK